RAWCGPPSRSPPVRSAAVISRSSLRPTPPRRGRLSSASAGMPIPWCGHSTRPACAAGSSA
ncbi:MAG: hypothetical protein ACK55Z_03890, partial [bacterium]